jgi:hypothetical protein
LSAITFVVVSRLTRPTPEANLRIFFDNDRRERSTELTAAADRV